MKVLEDANVAKAPFIIIGPERKRVNPNAWKALIRVIRQGHLKIVFQVGWSLKHLHYETKIIKIRKGEYTASPSKDVTVKQSQEQPQSVAQNNPEEKPVTTQEQPVEPAEASRLEQQQDDSKQPKISSTAKDVQIKGVKGKETSTPTPNAHITSVFPQSAEPGGSNAPRLLLNEPWNAHVMTHSGSEVSSTPKRRKNRLYTLRTHCWSGLSFFWASQIDIQYGFWATPWQQYYLEFCLEALQTMTEVVFAGLAHTVSFTESKISVSERMSHEILFCKVREEVILADLMIRPRGGGHTWPLYAINARGGTLDPEPHLLIEFSSFVQKSERLLPVLLLQSVRDPQSGMHDRSLRPEIIGRDCTIELASIDHWLSRAAQTRSISQGRLNLLVSTPRIIEDIWNHFTYHFMWLRHSEHEREGGNHHIRDLAILISDWLFGTPHSDVEHYFIWIALLRTIKVVQCIKGGPDTKDACDFFEDDVLVYFT